MHNKVYRSYCISCRSYCLWVLSTYKEVSMALHSKVATSMCSCHGRVEATRLCAYPRLVHRLLQLGEFSREVDAELPLHILLNVSGTHLALDMLPSDAAQVHLECTGFAAAGP